MGNSFSESNLGGRVPPAQSPGAVAPRPPRPPPPLRPGRHERRKEKRGKGAEKSRKRTKRQKGHLAPKQYFLRFVANLLNPERGTVSLSPSAQVLYARSSGANRSALVQVVFWVLFGVLFEGLATVRRFRCCLVGAGEGAAFSRLMLWGCCLGASAWVHFCEGGTQFGG